MSEIVLQSATRSRPAATSSEQQKVNRVYAWIVLAILAIAPLMLGSNRPFFWTLWAVVIGAAVCVYGWLLGRNRAALRVPLSWLKWEFLLAGVVMIYLLVQCLPMFGNSLPAIQTSTGFLLSSQTISVATGDTALMLLRWLTYAGFFVLTLQVSRNEGRRHFMMQALVVVLTAHAILAILMFYQWGNTILGLDKWAYDGSVTGTFVNRNSFATFMAMGISVAMSLLAEQLFGGVRTQARGLNTAPLLYALAALVMLGAVFGSNSRMGLAVSLGGAIFALIVGATKRTRSSRAPLAVIAGIIALLCVVAAVYGQSIWERFLAVEEASAVRFDLYKQVWGMIVQRPLLGYGGGAFEQAYGLFHTPPVNTELVWDRAHDTYLTLWVELGAVVGTIPMVLLLIGAGRIIVSLPHRQAGWAPQVACLAAILVTAFHSLVDFSLEMQANAFLLLALVAIALSGTVSNRKTDAPARG